MTLSTGTTTAGDPSSEGSPAALCSKCGLNPRARGSWCRECRRQAQREYNQRTRPRPEKKTADCLVCGASMSWISGQGPDRVYCTNYCKRKADTAVQTERRRAVRQQVDPQAHAALVERSALGQQGFRRCTHCGEVKVLSDDFHRRGSGHQSWCRDCVAERGQQDVNAAKRKSWRTHLKSRFNLTPERWDALLMEQAGRCYLCDDAMTDPFVDHDHDCCPGWRTCGKCVRGLACNSCNITIGHAQDDPDRLHLVADRLAAHKADLRRTVTG